MNGYPTGELHTQGAQPLILNLYKDKSCNAPSTEASLSIVEGECHAIQDNDIVSIMMWSNPTCESGVVVLDASDQTDCGNPGSLLQRISFYGAGECQVYTAGANIGSLRFGCGERLDSATITMTLQLDSNPGASQDPGLSVRDAEKETALTAAVVSLSVALALFGLLHILSCIYCPYCWIRMCHPQRGRRSERREEE
ncbi:hypothetical protein F5X99DRAFT_412042 [Biscogniauxia marginata]|nr:hypothetical protein F5X99DRAFT_412042 [Biscogniauxia marginata]